MTEGKIVEFAVGLHKLDRARREAVVRVLEGLPDSGDAVPWVLTPEGVVLFVGAGIEQLGYAPEQMQGKRFEDFLTPECAARLGAKVYLKMLTGKPSCWELEMLDGQGRPIRIEAEGWTLFDETGKPFRRFGVFRALERSSAEYGDCVSVECARVIGRELQRY